MNQKERRLVSIFLSELDELQARLSKALLKGDLLTGDNTLFLRIEVQWNVRGLTDSGCS
jgi:hypothetical protein